MSARVTAKRTCVPITLALLAILFVAVPIGSSRPSVRAIDGAQAQGPGPASNEPFADDTVLVGFTAGTRASDKQSVERDVGATDIATIGAGTHVLHVPKGQVEAKIDALASHGALR